MDTAADVSSYIIKRTTDPMSVYETIGSVTAFSGMNPMVQFTDDINVDANNTYYFYKVETINTCGDLKFTSNIARTIWLQVLSDPSQGTNTLTFTQYDGWLGNVQKYDVYRAVGGIWESSPVSSVAMFSDTTIYVDNVFDITQGDGEFCYKIIATENPVPHVGNLAEATSTSNEDCAFHDPLLYVPNAFAPTSHINYEFKPVLTFPDPTSYVLQIYNKWGQKIFETGDVNEGWNGRMENTGKMCQVDTYVYLIKFKSGEGDEFEKRGMVTLVN